MPPRESVIHRSHGADVVDEALLRVVGEPKQLRRKGILESAVGLLIGDFQAVAPIQPWIDAMLARALVEKGGQQLAPSLKLETAPFLRVGHL